MVVPSILILQRICCVTIAFILIWTKNVNSISNAFMSLSTSPPRTPYTIKRYQSNTLIRSLFFTSNIIMFPIALSANTISNTFETNQAPGNNDYFVLDSPTDNDEKAALLFKSMSSINFHEFTQLYTIGDLLGSGKYNSVYSLKYIEDNEQHYKKNSNNINNISHNRSNYSNLPCPYVMRICVSVNKIYNYVGTRQLVKLRLNLHQFLMRKYKYTPNIAKITNKSNNISLANDVHDPSIHMFIKKLVTDETFYSPEYNFNKTITDTESWFAEKNRLDVVIEKQKHNNYGTVLMINKPLNTFSITLYPYSSANVSTSKFDNFLDNKRIQSHDNTEKWLYDDQIKAPFLLNIEIQNKYSGSLDSISEAIKKNRFNNSSNSGYSGNMRTPVDGNYIVLTFSEILKLFYGYWHDQYVFSPMYHMDATLGNIFYNITTITAKNLIDKPIVLNENEKSIRFSYQFSNNQSNGTYHRLPKKRNIDFYWADFGCPRSWCKSNENVDKIIYCDWYTNPVSQFFEFCNDMLEEKYIRSRRYGNGDAISSINLNTITTIENINTTDIDSLQDKIIIQNILKKSIDYHKSLCNQKSAMTATEHYNKMIRYVSKIYLDTLPYHLMESFYDEFEINHPSIPSINTSSFYRSTLHDSNINTTNDCNDNSFRVNIMSGKDMIRNQLQRLKQL